MLALFGNLSAGEFLLVLLIAVMVFGRRLPEVAARTAIQLGKLRRSMSSMWRETGLSEEWRSLQRDVHGVARFDPRRAAREMTRDAAGRLVPPGPVRKPGEEPGDQSEQAVPHLPERPPRGLPERPPRGAAHGPPEGPPQGPPGTAGAGPGEPRAAGAEDAAGRGGRVTPEAGDPGAGGSPTS